MCIPYINIVVLYRQIIFSSVTCAETLFCVAFSKYFNVSDLPSSAFHFALC
jgi:hypothetical protein